MEYTPLILHSAPDLSDEAVTDIIDFLHELTTAMENHYYGQLKRYARHQPAGNQGDLFDEIEDEIPF